MRVRKLITKSKQAGVSLLEVILVVAIMGGISVLALRQYQSLRFDADARRLQANVDTIFHAMALYYKANCYGTTPPGGTLIPGTLNPNSPSFNPQFPIDLQVDLATPGYLQTSLTRVVSYNPLIDNSTGMGYITQFNEFTQDKLVCTQGTNATGPAPEQGCTQTAVVGQIILWKAQVAVLLKDPSKAAYYQKLLNADCTSTGPATPPPGPPPPGPPPPPPPRIVQPCVNNMPGPYLVWERLPSNVTPTNNSSYWGTNPTSKQLNQMYTTYPVGTLIDNSGKTFPSGAQQYFLCGG